MGSRSCRECHEHFYQLWESSFHGRAMMEVDKDFLTKNIQTCPDTFKIAGEYYSITIDRMQAFMNERSSGNNYPLELVLGGKYVYYFLTPLDKGKWQTLPLGYDIKAKEWFDITGSSMRVHQHHFDTSLHWKDRRYTFNTACYDCHVSQINNEYNLANDSYNTTWLEPGINCETCHGPAERHNTEFLKAAKTKTIPDSTYLQTFTRSRGYDRDIVDASCLYCHAKSIRITDRYIPGEDYFQHFDLICAENGDYYPDARDLGENYTFGTWLMSPCRDDERMDCLHCHTSSGRFRQKNNPNTSCLPCHADRVANASEHTQHPEGSLGNKCIACHMPKTTFARMDRSDHSMRPPVPMLTASYDSPNACNDCHTSKSPEWADSFIREHFSSEWQDASIEYANYLDQLRCGIDTKLDEILPYMLKPMDDFSLASMIRALDNVYSESISTLLYHFLQHNSPLIRSSAASGLGKYRDNAIDEALIKATQDSVRLVRIRAVAEISDLKTEDIPEQYRLSFIKALDEYKKSLTAYPAEESSHFNLGQFHEMQSKPKAAIHAYKNALRLRPELSQASNNLGMIYYERGQIDSSLYFLQEAIKQKPIEAAPYQNLGLLYAELAYTEEAIENLHIAMKLSSSPIAAYNLAILYNTINTDSTLKYAKAAYEFTPSLKYAYTYAYYLSEQGQSNMAIKVLEEIDTQDFNSYYLLSLLYKNSGMQKERETLMKAIKKDKQLSEKEKGLLLR